MLPTQLKKSCAATLLVPFWSSFQWSSFSSSLNTGDSKPSPGRALAKINRNNLIIIYSGEVVVASASNVLKFASVSNRKHGISGCLYVTNFKIAFVSTTSNYAGNPKVIVLWCDYVDKSCWAISIDFHPSLFSRHTGWKEQTFEPKWSLLGQHWPNLPGQWRAP